MQVDQKPEVHVSLDMDESAIIWLVIFPDRALRIKPS